MRTVCFRVPLTIRGSEVWGTVIALLTEVEVQRSVLVENTTREVVVGNYKKYKGQWVSGPHSEYFIHSKLFLDLHLLVPCTINYRKRAEQDGERGEDET